MWHKTCDMWHMIHDRWGKWTFSQNVSFLALTVWEWRCFEDIFAKDHWLNWWLMKVFNRPSVAGAILQTVLSLFNWLIESLSNSFSPDLQNNITFKLLRQAWLKFDYFDKQIIMIFIDLAYAGLVMSRHVCEDVCEGSLSWLIIDYTQTVRVLVFHHQIDCSIILL